MVRSDCPVCGKSRDLFEKPEKWLPFCSAHCKKVDLGKWFGGFYEITRPLEPDETIDSTPQDQND